MGEKSNTFSEFIKNNPMLLKASDLAYKYMAPLKRREKNKSMYNHVFDVAKYIFDIGERDIDILASAFLHDIIEDSHKSVQKSEELTLVIDKEYLTEHFNKKISNIVDNLTNFSSEKLENQIKSEFDEEDIKSDANLYKIKRQSYINGFMKHILKAEQLGIAEDLLFIKFFDRFHNMTTLEYHKKFKQTMIAQESLDIYVPLFYMVSKIPIPYIDRMIEMTFKYLYPYIYKNREIYITENKENFFKEYLFLKEYLAKNGYKCMEVRHKTRSLYRLHLTKSNFAGLNYAINEIIILVKEPKYKILTQKERRKQQIHAEKRLYSLMTELIHLRLEDEEDENKKDDHHYIVQDDAFKYSLNFDYSQSYLRPLPAMRLKLYTRKNNFMFQLNLTTESKLDSHYTRRNVRDWIQDLRGVKDSIINTKLGTSYNKLKVDFLKPVTVYTPGGWAHYLPNSATIRDYAFKIHSELGIFADYALINQIERVELSEKVKGFHGNVIEIIEKDKTEQKISTYRKLYSEVEQASSIGKLDEYVKAELKKQFPDIDPKDRSIIFKLFKKEFK